MNLTVIPFWLATVFSLRKTRSLLWIAANSAERMKLLGVPRLGSGQSGNWSTCVASRCRAASTKRLIAGLVASLSATGAPSPATER